MKNIRNTFMLVLLLLFWFARSCSAEQVYIMTEQEMVTLQAQLTKVNKQRSQLQQEFQMLKTQQEQLDNLARKLEIQLSVSKDRCSSLETQLMTVNKSFTEYSREVKSKLRQTKRERIGWILLTGGLAYLAVK